MVFVYSYTAKATSDIQATKKNNFRAIKSHPYNPIHFTGLPMKVNS